MSVRATTTIGNIQITCDATGIKHLMEQLSEYLVVLGNSVCKCESTQVVPEVRVTTKGHKYYSMTCLSCGRSYLFGQHSTGDTLFPKDRQWLTYEERRGGSSHGSDDPPY